MKIIRNGMEIELTDSELYSAWAAKQEQFDIEEIEYLMEDDDDVSDEELNNPQFVSAVAQRWRKYMDNQESGDLEYDCYYDALDCIRKTWKEEK